MNTAPAYTITEAKYAGRYSGNHQKAIKCPGVNGYKSRAARLAEALKGRYTSRERAYILSATKAARFEQLYAAGFDANPVTHELVPPRQPDPVPHPVRAPGVSEEQFVAGEPVRYLGYANAEGERIEFIASYRPPRDVPVRYVEVRKASDGSIVMAPVYKEPEARAFFRHIERNQIGKAT